MENTSLLNPSYGTKAFLELVEALDMASRLANAVPSRYKIVENSQSGVESVLRPLIVVTLQTVEAKFSELLALREEERAKASTIHESWKPYFFPYTIVAYEYSKIPENAPVKSLCNLIRDEASRRKIAVSGFVPEPFSCYENLKSSAVAFQKGQDRPDQIRDLAALLDGLKFAKKAYER